MWQNYAQESFINVSEMYKANWNINGKMHGKAEQNLTVSYKMDKIRYE